MLLSCLGLIGPLAGCKQEAPAPWNAMGMPLRHGEILPGADADNLRVLYRKAERQEDFYREFKNALERGGFAFVRDGKDHDPPGKTFSGVYQKGALTYLLTVTGHPDTSVEIKRID